jgi:hypothetical protein
MSDASSEVSREAALAILADSLRHLEDCYRQMQEAPPGSALRKLSEFYVERYKKFHFLITMAVTAESLNRDPAQFWVPDALNDQLTELMSYLLPEDRHPGEFEKFLLQHGTSPIQAAEFLKRSKTDERGARPTKRLLFVRGLDMQAQGASYQQIVKALCDCGRPQWTPPEPHDRYCQERFRQGMKLVRELLQKYEAPPDAPG